MENQQYFPVKIASLADLIWEQKTETPASWTILPSGKVELIFRIGSPDPQMEEAAKIDKTDNPLSNFCFLSGLHTQPLVMRYNRFHYMGIQMKPIAVKALFGIPLHEIRDYYVEGSLLLKSLQEIEDRLKTFPDFRQRAIWLENYFYHKVRETPDLHQAVRLHDASNRIISETGAASGKSIEAILGYSRTQSYRIFNDWFGLSVHSYQKLVQFVQAIGALHYQSGSLTEIGLELGYFDQSHFIRSFRSFSGITPGEYRKRMSPMIGQFPT